MNAKGDLIARMLNLGLGAPAFETQSSGPPHEQLFSVRVLAGGKVLGAGGQARSKKEAERLAAESALRALTPQAVEGAEDAAPLGGPWPIYAPVLAQALDTALELCPEDATLDEVRAEAARLYRDLLAELGHGPARE